MTVRRRVVVLTVACLVFVGLMIGIMVAGLWISDNLARRVAGIHGRIDVLSQLQAKVGVYGEQAAETMLKGAMTDDFKTARIDVELLLPRLTQATRAESTTLTDLDEVQGELPELEGARRIVELYHSIDALMNNALSLLRVGPKEVAFAADERSVSFRLANELLPLLQGAANDEREEIDREIAKTATAGQPLFIGAAAAGALGLAVIIGLGIGLWRGVAGSIGAQRQQASGLADGDVDVAPPALRGEFEGLAQSLASLGSSLAAQRRTLAEAGERLTSEANARAAQLHDANEQLREIARRRGQFLAAVSHELRTPLTILRGEADVALRGKDDPQLQRQSLERIQGQASELGQLLEDLIEFARSTAEDRPLVMVDASLGEVVAAAAQEARMLASPREVAVVLAPGDGGRHIDADFRRLK